MNYDFPFIEKIDDVLPSIKDREEFGVYTKDDGYTVIDYNVSFADTFPEINSMNDAIRRECRGILFDENGKLIRRAYHKFFNYGEKEETHNFDISSNHIILEKLDGSMIAPFYYKNEIVYGTMHGRTFLTPEVEKFIEKNNQYNDFVNYWLNAGYTPIFEYCSPTNRIVVFYPETKLILTGIRHMHTGEYVKYDQLVKSVKEFNIDYVKVFDHKKNFNEFLDYVKNLSDKEGFVIVNEFGHRLKFKADEYCRKHKIKENMSFEKNILDVILNDDLDDLLPIVDEIDRKNLQKYNDSVMHHIYEYAHYLKDTVNNEITGDFKEFAIRIKHDPSKKNDMRFFRKVYDNDMNVDEIVNMLKETIKSYLSNSTRMETQRYIFKTKWEDIALNNIE